jgi:alpha-galactosidase
MDYAILSQYSIQSTSDQMDYRNYSIIAANASTAVTPEQAAVWSYPLGDGDEEETAFNMVNAILLRIHQSGHLANLSANRLSLVKEGLDYYKKIRSDIKVSHPLWPIGLAHYRDDWNCSAICNKNRMHIAIWRKNSKSDFIELPLKKVINKNIKVLDTYPHNLEFDYQWNKNSGKLIVKLPQNMSARIISIEVEDKNEI